MMFGLMLRLFHGGLERSARRLTATVVLLLAGAVLIAVAGGFGLAVLTLWLQQIYGTMPAYAIVGGGCAAIAALFVGLALWRPARHRAATPETDAIKQAFEEAIASVQHGSRETMLTALALALVAGLTAGRKI
jgi:hypothetical protein